MPCNSLPNQILIQLYSQLTKSNKPENFEDKKMYHCILMFTSIETETVLRFY